MFPDRLLVLFACFLMLGGCGFQLRGSEELAVDRIHLAGAYVRSPVGRALAGELEVQGIQLVGSLPDVIVLELIDEHSSRRRIATSALIDAAEYELRLVLTFSVSRNGDLLMGDLTLGSQRIYEVDQDNLSGSHEEERLLLAEMRADLARQVIRSIDVVLRHESDAL